MAKLERVNWSPDLVVSGTLISCFIEALEHAVDLMSPEQVRALSDRIEARLDEMLPAQGPQGVEGIETARSAFHKIIRT
jgi:hypothetical protein